MAKTRKLPKNQKIEITPEERNIMNTNTQTYGTIQEKAPTTLQEVQNLENQQAAIRETEQRNKEQLLIQNQEKQLSEPLPQISGDYQSFPTSQETEEPKSDTEITYNKDGTITYTRGGKTFELTKEEYDVAVLGKPGMQTDKIKEIKALPSISEMKAQELTGQVGQFNQLGISPTGLDYGEAAVEGMISGIPNGLKWIGGAMAGGAAIGAKFGAVAGTAAGPAGTAAGAGAGAIIGGAVVAFASIANSMIGNMKSQRRDTTTAQQRVLDEGKQTMNDWITLADADPGNKARYLAEYNKVAAQIDQAYRQMKLDVSRDAAKFETALPNLAEFETFYAVGGERDTLNAEMTRSILTPIPRDYKMIDLANRYK